jgi:hypothetical protein
MPEIINGIPTTISESDAAAAHIAADNPATALNTTHRSSDGKNHADVVTNTAGIATNVTAIGLNTTHRGLNHDYAHITGNDGNTDVTGAELEELTDASETTLHSHAGAAAGFDSRISVYRSTNQSIDNTTWTKVQFNGEFWDGLNEFDSATNYRFTAAATGYYLMQAAVNVKSLGAGKTCEVRFTINGSHTGPCGPNGKANKHDYGSYSGDQGVHTLSLTANDYVEVEFWHDHGSALNIGEDVCYFTVDRQK